MLKSSNLGLEMEPNEFEKTLNVPKLSLDRPWSGMQQLSWPNYKSRFKNIWPSLPFFFTDTSSWIFIRTQGFSWNLQATLLSLLGFLEITLRGQHTKPVANVFILNSYRQKLLTNLFQSRNIICPVAPSHPVPTLEPGTPDIFVHKHTKIFLDEHTLPQDDTH